MAVDAATIQTLNDTASAFIEAGDDASALPYLKSLANRLMGIPDSTMAEMKLEWSGREQILELIKSIQQDVSGSAGIQKQKITYKAATG